MLNEPLTYELFRELLLGLTLGEFLLVAVSIEITAGVGGVDFVDEIYLTVALAKLVFGIHEDQSALGGNLLATLEDLAGVFLHHGIVLCRYDTLSDDLLFRDVHVVPLVSLGRRRDDGLWETLVLLHAVGQLHAT